MQENNITSIELDGKELILIGTAHVSKQSAEQVKEVIERESLIRFVLNWMNNGINL